MPIHAASPEASLPPAVAGPAFLRNGAEVWVRPVRPEDQDLVDRFGRTVSLDGLEERYFAAVRPATAEEEVVATAPVDDRLCLIVLGDQGRWVGILGVGEYVRTSPGSPLAEVAFLVSEPFRGLGIATLLLARLARAARAYGIVRFVARVRNQNPEMLEVFRTSGLPFTEERVEDEVDVVFPILPPETVAEPRTTGPSDGPRPPRRTVRHAVA